MATNNSNMLAISQLNVDMVATYGYRSTDFGFIAGGANGSIHFIFGTVSPVGLLAGVPDASVHFNVATGAIYLKKQTTATSGVGSGKSGTWTLMSV